MTAALRRLRLAAPLLGLLGVGPVAADEPVPGGPPPDPVAAAAWDARDMEGRWALMAADPDVAHGRFSPVWTEFLVRRGEWALLEWAALATDGSLAIKALKDAGRPTWVRAAVWGLSKADSHSGNAGSDALRTQPALVRGWFRLHPEAAASGRAKGFAQSLASEGGPVDLEGARRLEPPYHPERLLAALSPPTLVASYGERRRAEVGVTYVHQVERALAVWLRSPLDGETWDLRIAALLRHPVADVRRAAALACTLEEPSLPLRRALFALMDDPRAAPDARSAAVVALGSSWALASRLRVLEVGLDPRHPSFTAALSTLADHDQGFALAAWRTLDVEPAGPAAQAFLAEQRRRLQERLAAVPPDQRAGRAPALLALAAYADVVRSPHAAALVAWSLECLGRWAAEEPSVRQWLGEQRADASSATHGADDDVAVAVALRARLLVERVLAPVDPIVERR